VGTVWWLGGVNVVKPSGYSVGKESGSREPEAARGFDNGGGDRQVCIVAGMVRT